MLNNPNTNFILSSYISNRCSPGKRDRLYSIFSSYIPKEGFGNENGIGLESMLPFEGMLKLVKTI